MSSEGPQTIFLMTSSCYIQDTIHKGFQCAFTVNMKELSFLGYSQLTLFGFFCFISLFMLVLLFTVIVCVPFVVNIYTKFFLNKI